MQHFQRLSDQQQKQTNNVIINKIHSILYTNFTVSVNGLGVVTSATMILCPSVSPSSVIVIDKVYYQILVA